MHAHDIMEHWPLHNVSIGAVSQTYSTRQVVRIHADQGDFAVKIDAAPLATAAVSESLHVFDYLAARKFRHVPALLHTRTGDSFIDIAGKRVWIMEYITGHQLDFTVQQPWNELGRVAAELSAYTDYPFAYQIPVDAAITELASIRDRYTIQPQYQELLARLRVLETEQPMGLLHGELHPGNCVQQPDGTIVLLDWDEAGTGPTVLEAAYPLITVFLSEDLTFHDVQAAAFYQGYTGGKRMDAHTKDALFSAALLHALRYMRFANPERRWQRIQHAVEREAFLLSVVP